MRLYNVYGKLQNKNVNKQLIKWSKKSRSKIQFKVKAFLRPFWQSHIVYEEFPVYGTRMKVDILNATNKIAIEVQGLQHEQFNKFFHKNSRTNYLEGIKRDYQKGRWLEQNNFKLLEIRLEVVDDLSVEFFMEKFQVLLI